MFSQTSFRPLDQVPIPHPVERDLEVPSPSISSTPATPSPRQELITPFEEDHEGAETSGPLGKIEEEYLAPRAREPSPRSHDNLKPPPVSHSHSLQKENMDEFVPSSPQSFTSKSSRISASPSRHHGLTALSPLQAFSPLQTARTVPTSKASSDAGSLSGRSRASSVTKSLSRRDSLIAHAARWGRGDDQAMEEGHDSTNNFFSRLTLVKAPSENPGVRRHNRSKSSSSLTPFSTFAAANDSPATSARGPRRSFAASSFGGISPLSIAKQPASIPTYSYYDNDDVQSRHKPLSPDQVVEIARQLESPVMLPEKGSLLRRRKSAGPSFKLGLKEKTDEKGPVALEPVEYRQLDEEVLLPFIERATEVDELIKHPANEKLFKLLKAAFPKDPARPNWRRLQPEEWYWEELLLHLTQVDRDEIPDYEWTFRTRQAVRQRSISLWEKLGICLGCDGDLLNAGGEDDIPPSWGGLGLGEEGEYDPSMNQVWIEGLEAVDPNDAVRAEKALAAAFGEIVEDEGEQAAAGMTALLGTIGESNEAARAGLTTAQRAGNRDRMDPMGSPSAQFKTLSTPPRASDNAKQTRSKSFVGLQIRTQPSSPPMQVYVRSPTSQLQTPVMEAASLPVYERGPESPMFPSSFSSLSREPNLGRSASVALAGNGIRVPPPQEDFRLMSKRGLVRKSSGAGLSESAITFASESDYA